VEDGDACHIGNDKRHKEREQAKDAYGTDVLLEALKVHLETSEKNDV